MSSIGELPDHIEQSVQAIAALHTDHDKRASRIQRIAEVVLRLASRPRFAIVLLIIIGAWMLVNVPAFYAGRPPFDPPPFPFLQDVIATVALFLTILILIAQRREAQLDERRARLSLQLALLSEQKNAKIVEMLETLLRAHPGLEMPHDPTVSEMSKPADSAAMLSAIDRTQREGMDD